MELSFAVRDVFHQNSKEVLGENTVEKGFPRFARRVPCLDRLKEKFEEVEANVKELELCGTFHSLVDVLIEQMLIDDALCELLSQLDLIG